MSCFLQQTSFIEMLTSFSSGTWHLPTLPKVPKPSLRTMRLLCLIGQQPGVSFEACIVNVFFFGSFYCLFFCSVLSSWKTAFRCITAFYWVGGSAVFPLYASIGSTPPLLKCEHLCWTFIFFMRGEERRGEGEMRKEEKKEGGRQECRVGRTSFHLGPCHLALWMLHIATGRSTQLQVKACKWKRGDAFL